MPAPSSALCIRVRVSTIAPDPFSNRLTVFAATPARLAKSRTPQASAALAILICAGIIIGYKAVDMHAFAVYPVHSQVDGQIMTASVVLKSELRAYELLRHRLLSEHPDLDDETIRDTLEGITTLHELIAELIRSALLDEALQAALRTRLEEMRSRLARLAERGLKKRQLALEAMNEAGLKKLEQPDFTASARLGAPPLVVTSEQSIPPAYWVPQPPKLDRQSLLGDLKRGNDIPGACLGNANPVLAVRTK